MLGIGIGVSPMINRKGGYNAITTAWIAQVIANGGSVTGAEATAISTYTDAIQIGEFDRLWVHGLQNEIAAKTSIVNPTSTMITNVNSTTFTAGEGFTGNGTTMYLNTNYNPNSDAVKMTQNSSLFGSYFITNLQSGKVQGALVGLTGLYLFDNTINLATAHNDANDDSSNFTTNKNGLIVTYRDSSADKYIFLNGTQSTAMSRASNGLVNGNLYLLGWNLNGAASSFLNSQIGVSFAGSHLANTGLYTATQTLATTLGFNV